MSICIVTSNIVFLLNRAWIHCFRWMTQVGGRLGTVFDEDPKRWRMVAEVFSTTGLALEIATAIYPASFIALAGAGNLSKAVARGMKNPCFRVVQTHFAQQRANVGDIAAKEEVGHLLSMGFRRSHNPTPSLPLHPPPLSCPLLSLPLTHTHRHTVRMRSV
jgi:hypothetical protein